MGYHFGVDYYPEHWPRERWQTDARMMREMGITIVRMAEFSWAKWEPREGDRLHPRHAQRCSACLDH